MSIKQLAHVNIMSHDLAEAEKFYCGLLGLEKGFEFIRNGEVFGFYIKAGENTFIEIFKLSDAANFDRPIIPHLCLEVEDIDAVIRHIRENGWEISDKKLGRDEAWQAWITDPSGVRIELMQYTEASSQFTGNPCYID